MNLGGGDFYIPAEQGYPIMEKTTPLGVSEIATAATQPIDVTPAPAAGYILVPVKVLIFGSFNGVAWGGPGAAKFQLHLFNATVTGAQALYYRSANGFSFTGNINYELPVNPNSYAITSGFHFVPNEPLVFSAFIDPVGGNSEMGITVFWTELLAS